LTHDYFFAIRSQILIRCGIISLVHVLTIAEATEIFRDLSVHILSSFLVEVEPFISSELLKLRGTVDMIDLTAGKRVVILSNQVLFHSFSLEADAECDEEDETGD
jgi:hypothetical protein